MARFVVICLSMFLASGAAAQLIDCGPGGADCSETVYGLGNDPLGGPFVNTTVIARAGPGDGSCGPEIPIRFQGQIRIREQDNCVVSATQRCPVEIPQIAEDSGYFNTSIQTIPLGPLGIVRVLGAQFTDMAGNLGFRQLSGTCTLDAGQECAIDADCPSNAGCRSSCFSTGEECAGHADCPSADCRTELEWDGIGTCGDRTTVCSSDGDCPAEDRCIAGFEWEGALSSCVCCQSSLGTVCPIFLFNEYPALNCGVVRPRENHVAAPDWLFEGGRGAAFGLETIMVPGQQEGVCAGNRGRPCGVNGDFWAGVANGKCIGVPPCPDPVIGDPTQGAEASTCDDVAFGGIEGDVCDLSEDWIRNRLGLNSDGSQDITKCEGSFIQLVGTPGALCALTNDIPDGDPQPGCSLINVGVVTEPDMDCNGIDDTTEGRCMPVGGVTCSDPALCAPCADDIDCASGNCVNNGDLCPFIGEANWFRDLNNDDIGDECQCGDGNNDGAITTVDIAAVALCANGVVSCDATLVDATGDNATTAEDIGGVVAVVNGAIQTSALECIRNLDTTVP